MTPEPPTTYHLGGLERRGLIGRLRPTQLAVLGAAGAAAVGALFGLGPALGLVAAVTVLAAGGLVALIPVGRRPLPEWAPVALRHGIRRAAGRSRWRAPEGQRAATSASQPVAFAPPTLAGLRQLELPLATGIAGMLYDPAGPGWVVTLACTGRSFLLADQADKAARLDGLARLFDALAREGSPIDRIQLTERTLPADATALRRFAAERRPPGFAADDPAAITVERLLRGAAGVAPAHEVLVTLRLSPARAGGALRRAGGGDAGARVLLVREVVTVASALAEAGIEVLGVLTGRQQAAALRAGFDPAARPGLARLAGARPGRGGDETTLAAAWPAVTETTWAHYRTAPHAYHATYWVAEWPREPIGPDGLAPLFVRCTVQRAVAVCLEPVPRSKARAQERYLATNDAAEQLVRARYGFADDAEHRAQRDATHRRREELTRGHAVVRFSGWVTVTGTTAEALADACAEVEYAAAEAGLELAACHGEQDSAFSATLPLARGLA